MLRHFMRAGWLLGLVACVACGAGVEEGGLGPEDGTSSAERPGLGHSKAAPQGQPYSLPAGIELAQPLTGKKYDCVQDEQERLEKGSGTQVVLCVALRNTSSRPIQVELPPGLIFVSADLATQNGLLVQEVAVEVSAQQTLLLGLHLFCLNEDRGPSAPWDTFTLGPVTQDSGLREVITLLEDKQLPVAGPLELQDAIANVTSGPGLTAQDREALERLPPRSTGLAPRTGR